MAPDSSVLAWQNSMGRGVWQATVRGVTKSLKQLSTHTHRVKFCRGMAERSYPTSEVGAVAALCWSTREERPHIQGKRNPSKMVGAEREGQRADRLKLQSQATTNLITPTTPLSNSVKLSHTVWGQPRWMAHGGGV